MATKVSPAAALLQWWARLHALPGGRWLFARILSFGIPYTGTIRPEVQQVEAGYARVRVRDRRRLRNHLASIHAIALANLGELAGGLAMTATLPPTIRGILVGLRVDYNKKARGTLIAECRCNVPPITVATDFEVQSVVTDAAGDVVATVTGVWRLDPQ